MHKKTKNKTSNQKKLKQQNNKKQTKKQDKQKKPKVFLTFFVCCFLCFNQSIPCFGHPKNKCKKKHKNKQTQQKTHKQQEITTQTKSKQLKTSQTNTKKNIDCFLLLFCVFLRWWNSPLLLACQKTHKKKTNNNKHEYKQSYKQQIIKL